MRVLVLGSDGFVGKNLLEDLSRDFQCKGSTRRKEILLTDESRIHFDLTDKSTWQSIIEFAPDCIVNCIVSGAIRTANDVKNTIDTNYISTIELFDFLAEQLPHVYLVHIGSAFEYDQSIGGLTETSPCIPRTYYGISKYLTSQYLLNNNKLNDFTIIRSFNLFGPYDKEEKLIPYLICAQRDKKPVALSGGQQERDYFYVKDLSQMISHLIRHKHLRVNTINAGLGNSLTLQKVAITLAKYIPTFEPSLWQWGKLPYREGEGKTFYNASSRLKDMNITFTEFDQAIKDTVMYYCAAKKTEKVC
ncbi:MAG TPA: NAD-dependent epimerase/dehydratase [Flavisolibacter sp.]|nr:NAD-dependent epimerase/dehydratase [Flavisolibacter sp.]